MKQGKPHRHARVKRHVLGQRNGLPYEVELTMCRHCGAVLAERPLRRAVA